MEDLHAAHKRPAVCLNLLCKVPSELRHGIAARGVGAGTEGLVRQVLADRVLQRVTPLTQRERWRVTHSAQPL